MPFTAEQFFDVFAAYNELIYPAQWLLIVLAVIICAALLFEPVHNTYISIGFAVLWAWTGAIYHLYSFTSISGAAYLFGGAFIFEGLLFLLFGACFGGISFRVQADAPGFVGALSVLYALLIYPLIGYILGHQYPKTPTFGAPCPVTIFTLGILLFADKCPFYIYAVPLIWSAVATSAAYLFGVYVAATTVGFFVGNARHRNPSEEARV